MASRSRWAHCCPSSIPACDTDQPLQHESRTCAWWYLTSQPIHAFQISQHGKPCQEHVQGVSLPLAALRLSRACFRLGPHL